MTQKQMFGVAIGVFVIVFVSFFVYKQFSADTKWQTQSGSSVVTPKKTTQSETEMKQQVVVPNTIDSISQAIVEESSVDSQALDEEESGEAEEVDADADSINNLENSYDENN